MFCPYCAAEDRDHSQYCRSCGAELHTVRTALQRPDSITGAAAGAREEIGRAIADRIRQIKKDDDLKEVVEDVLPKIEKFLESPEARRMRQFREGVISSAVGLGAIILFLLASPHTNGGRELLLTFIGAGAGCVSFLVGIGLLINARWFTVPARTSEISRTLSNQILSGELSTGSLDNELASSNPSRPSSVTEGTTRQLK
jgi:hypothetical protein